MRNSVQVQMRPHHVRQWTDAFVRFVLAGASLIASTVPPGQDIPRAKAGHDGPIVHAKGPFIAASQVSPTGA